MVVTGHLMHRVRRALDLGRAWLGIPPTVIRTRRVRRLVLFRGHVLSRRRLVAAVLPLSEEREPDAGGDGDDTDGDADAQSNLEPHAAVAAVVVVCRPCRAGGRVALGGRGPGTGGGRGARVVGVAVVVEEDAGALGAAVGIDGAAEAAVGTPVDAGEDESFALALV